MTVTEVVCDRCGARKEKANGWYVLRIEDNAFHIAPSDKRQWEDQKDICSDNCAMILLSEFLGGKNG